MVIAEVSVVPIGTGTTSLSNYIAGAVRVLEAEKDIKYELTAMGTIIEGDLEKIMGLVKKMHQSAFDAGVFRVVTTVKIDDRRDKAATISSKIASVKSRLDASEGG